MFAFRHLYTSLLIISFLSGLMIVLSPTRAVALEGSLLESIAEELIKDALDIEPPNTPTNASDCGLADCDSDGRRSYQDGGQDCDDNDTNRFPGNVEVADTLDHDEDCDPTTYGAVDNDDDGYNSSDFCNRDAEGILHCGFDCDDSNYAIGPGTQICDPQKGSKSVLICAKTVKSTPPPGTFVAGKWLTSKCSGKCVAQPNGTGVCVN